MPKFRMVLGEDHYLTRQEVAKNPWRYGDVLKAAASLDMAAMQTAVAVYNDRGQTDPDHPDVWWVDAADDVEVEALLGTFEECNQEGAPQNSWATLLGVSAPGSLNNVRVCGPLVYLVERPYIDQWKREKYQYLLRDGTWTDDLCRPDLVLRDEGTVVKPPELDERAQVEEVFGLTGGELASKPWKYTPDPPPAEWGWCNATKTPADGWLADGFIERSGQHTFEYHYDGVPEYLEGEYRQAEGDYATVCCDELFGERDTPWGYHRIERYSTSGETTIDRYEDRDGNTVPAQLVYLGDGWGEVVYKAWTYCADPEDDADTAEWCERPAWEDFTDDQQQQPKVYVCRDTEGVKQYVGEEGWQATDGWPGVADAGDCAHPERYWRWYFGNVTCPLDRDWWRYRERIDDTHVPLRYHQWVPWYGPNGAKLDALIAQYPEVRLRQQRQWSGVSVLGASDAEHDAFRAAVRLADT